MIIVANKKKIISFNQFNLKRESWAKSLYKDNKVRKLKKELYIAADKKNFCYLYSWFGEPMLQTPDDILTIQEIIWETKPDVILEVGVAWGGMILLYDSLAKKCGIKKIIGVDIFIPKDLINRVFSKVDKNKVFLINDDSTSNETFNKIKKIIGKYKNIMIHLDSNHTKKHVLDELLLYSKLCKKNNYIIVSDTIIEHIPKQKHRAREWSKGNNPKNAVDEFLKINKKFKVDLFRNYKQLLTNNPKGFIKKI